jgi:hypothetical protein
MSKNQYISSLERQIRILNEHIDAKIISGQHYAAESRKHKMLLRKIREQKQEQRKGVFGRLFPIFA